ncbi:MAG: PTS sugar transporter subunit IIA [Elusimicrobia bacterium]|nr:PTS sugar transporter subunit IIA [Elusimicrobiota bacterium]
MDLNLRDAAKILNVSESTLSRWINDEGLPAFMINGRYRFNRIDLLEWANHRRIPAAALYHLPEGGLPSLDSLLEGNIHHNVPGSDKTAVMAAVADRLPLASPRDKVLAVQALSHREAKGSTVIDGIAIPHARSPLIFGVDRAILTLCFLKEAVSFGAPEQTPVHIVWAVVSPTIRAHLTLLAKVASALHDAEFRQLLDRHAAAPEILARLRQLA